MINVEFGTNERGGFAIEHYQDSATVKEIRDDIIKKSGWDYASVWVDDGDVTAIITSDGHIQEV